MGLGTLGGILKEFLKQLPMNILEELLGTESSEIRGVSPKGMYGETSEGIFGATHGSLENSREYSWSNT